MEQQKITVRRIGSLTFGLVLIAVGIVYLISIFYPALDVWTIMKFWPLILILLGVEVLFGCRQENHEVVGEQGKVIEQSRVVYDVTGILLMILLVGLGMFLGILTAIDWEWYRQYWMGM